MTRTSVLEVPAAPKPRMSTPDLAPFTLPNRLVVCTPGSRASKSCSVCPGDRSISCAVITVDEAPVMIVPVTMPEAPALSAGASVPTSAPLPGAAPRRAPRAPPTSRVLVTAISGSTVSSGCADAGPHSSAATPAASANAPPIRRFNAPITRVLRSRPLRDAGDRTETKAHERARPTSESGNRRNPAVGPLAAHALVRGRRHSARPRIGYDVTAANSRSVWSFRPPVG